MKILRIAIVGAVSYFAYKSWRKRVAQGQTQAGGGSDEETADDRAEEMIAKGRAAVDEGQRTQPHGDPLADDVVADDVVEDDADVGGSPQSSRGFGGT